MMSTPSQLPKVPAHLYGTRAAIFFLMHPSRASDHKISKSKKYSLTSNAGAFFVPVNTVNVHGTENQLKTEPYISIAHADTDEFHFNSTRLN